MKTIQKQLCERIGVLMNCDPKVFLQEAIEFEMKKDSTLDSYAAEEFVVLKIIKLRKDQTLKYLWDIYSRGVFYENNDIDLNGIGYVWVKC